MIPQQTLENYPVFGDNATKVQPDSAKMAAGFQQADVLPAEWMNWAWNKNSKGIREANQGLTSIEAEIINVLTAAGITPAEATQNQLLQAMQYLITAKTGTLSDLTTEVKTSLVAACNEIKSNLDTHEADTTNPHAVTKSQVGLENVANVGTEATPTSGSGNNITSGAVYSHTSNTSNPHQVTGSQLAGNVPSSKIDDGAITRTKLSSGLVQTSLSSTNDQIPTGAAVIAAIAAEVTTGSNSNGNYLKLKNGLTVQWGNFPKGSNLSYQYKWESTIYFPINFSTNTYTINMTCGSTEAGAEFFIKSKAGNAVNFGLMNRNGGTSMPNPVVNWIAIGY